MVKKNEAATVNDSGDKSVFNLGFLYDLEFDEIIKEIQKPENNLGFLYDLEFDEIIKEIQKPENNFNLPAFLECASELKEVNNVTLKNAFKSILEKTTKEDLISPEKLTKLTWDVKTPNDIKFKKINEVIHSKSNPVIDDEARKQCVDLIKNINLSTKLRNIKIYDDGPITESSKKEWLQTLELNILILEGKLNDKLLESELNDELLERELNDELLELPKSQVDSSDGLKNFNTNSKEINPNNNNTTTATAVKSKFTSNFLAPDNNKKSDEKTQSSQGKESWWKRLVCKGTDVVDFEKHNRGLK